MKKIMTEVSHEFLLTGKNASTTNQKLKVEDDNLHFHVKILSALGLIKSVIGLRANKKCYWPGSLVMFRFHGKISAYMNRITWILNDIGIKGNIKNIDYELNNKNNDKRILLVPICLK